ncbi:MAG: hypothetical protein IJR13_06915 [Bacteroidales bacterium]|nr:hypothetical protein [Bacteroidales bacterium]
MIEAIIGREPGRRRLQIIVGEKTTTIGNDMSVPQDISRRQFRLQMDGETLILTNLKPETTPIYINGLEAVSQPVTLSDRVQIGYDLYGVDIAAVVEAIKKMPKPAVIYSIGHLKKVWEDYQTTKLKMMDNENRKNAVKGLASVVSMAGTIVAIVIPNTRSILIIIAASISIILALMWILPSFKRGSSIQARVEELNKQLKQDYVCPNPDCHHFLGKPYEEIVNIGKCPKCNSRFQE